MKRLLVHNNRAMSGEPLTVCLDRVFILERLSHPSIRLAATCFDILRCAYFPARREGYIWRDSLDESVSLLVQDPGNWCALNRAKDGWDEYVAGYYQS